MAEPILLPQRMPAVPLPSALDLYEGQRQVRAIFDACAIGWVELGVDGRISAVNASFTTMARRPPEQITGSRLTDLLVLEDRAGLRAMLDRHFALQAEGDLLGGLDLAAHPRVEAIGLGSLLLFLNPQDPFQVFLEGSLGLDVSRISGATGVPSTAPTYTYYNAVAGGGLGAEWRVLRRFALVGEARGLLRARVSGLSSDDTLMRDGQGHEATAGAMLATLVGGKYEF